MGGRVVHRHTVPDGGGGTVVPLCPHVPRVTPHLRTAARGERAPNAGMHTAIWAARYPTF